MAESAQSQWNGNVENQTSESDSQDEAPTRWLRLKVIAGHNLAKKDIFGASDPYVRVDLLSGDKDTVLDTYITKTKKRTLNPVWDEQFMLKVTPIQILKIEVFDENRLTRDDFLGLVEVPLLNIPTERPGRTINAKHYILRPRSSKSRVKGYLEIYHAYQYTGTPEDDDSSSQQETEVGWEMVNTEDGAHHLEESPASPSMVPTPPSNHSPLPIGWEERWLCLVKNHSGLSWVGMDVATCCIVSFASYLYIATCYVPDANLFCTYCKLFVSEILNEI